MSAISSVNMASTDAGTTQSTPSTAKTDALASRDTFLKLLVAQLRNQNPLNPQDGTQFVSQLAQFSTLEQTAQMSEDISAIRKALTGTTGTDTTSQGAN